MSLNILIVTHYFPPVPGVGGRRWAKFVKYLSQEEGVKVHVVSALNTVTDVKSSFEEELKNYKFSHTPLPSNYPKYLEFLEFAKITLWRKIMFRYQLFWLKKKVKGNYWDFSVCWEKNFKNEITEIIKKDNIDKIIVSGPPFRYIKYALNLKVEFPTLEVVLDYRDPWVDFNDPYPIGDERTNYEIALEKEMLSKVDKIITVSNFQKGLILNNVPNAAPIYVIPNGFDKDDYTERPTAKKDLNKVIFTHFGTMHYLKDYYWVPFFNAFSRLKLEQPLVYQNIQIELIGYCPKMILDYIAKRNLNVKVHGILEPSDAFVELSKADVAIWFKYDGSPGDFATKFGDYIGLKKFIWTFSKPGDVTTYIEKEKIGKVFYRDNQNLEEQIFQSFIDSVKKENRLFNPNYDPESLQINALTKKLIEVLNS